MKTLISGSSGLIGSAFLSSLNVMEYEVFRLIRKKSLLGENAIYWDPDTALIHAEDLEGFDIIIHLAGENIAKGRWTKERKAQIHNSRINSTKILVKAITTIKRPPSLFISASAVGFYGDRGNELLTEDSRLGNGFLAELCRDWENASYPLKQLGIRVVYLRFGMVLSPRGGALKKMLLPFRSGLGGTIGNGKQYISWISLDDVIGILIHVIHTTSLEGAINCVTPDPVTNREFTRCLGKVLRRPTILPLPAFLAKIIFGEMANALLLASSNVVPKKLISTGYHFRHPNIYAALSEFTH